MKGTSIRYASDGSIDLIDVEVSDPGRGEIQLQGGVCGICSWDIVTCKLGDKMHPMAPPGHEGMGYVVKVGPGVTDFREGDRVAGGGFATLRNISTSRAYKIPESDLADKHWIVEPVSCIVTGLDHCRLRPGDTVVVIGCGFMGLMLLQGLLHSYAGQVIAIDIAPNRVELARQLGAEEAYCIGDVDMDDLVASLKARTVDTVVDSTGSQAGLNLATDIVKRGGLINLFGWIKGDQAAFDPTKWHLGGFSIVNSAPASKLRDTFPPAIDLIHKGIIDLRPLVTHMVALPEYPKLMANILSGDQEYVKGVIALG